MSEFVAWVLAGDVADDGRGVLWGGDEDESDTAVEGVEHFMVGDVTACSDVLKDWWDVDFGEINDGAEVWREDAAEVSVDAAACYVCHAVEDLLWEEVAEGFVVGAVRLHDCFDEGFAVDNVVSKFREFCHHES